MLEANIAIVAAKYGPKIQELNAQVESEQGLIYSPTAPLTEEQKQRLLFGRFFAGVGKPLQNTPGNYKQISSQRAFVNYRRIVESISSERLAQITRKF